MSEEKKYLLESAMIGMLRKACKAAGGNKAWGEKHQFNPSHIGYMLVGKRPIMDRTAKALGYQRMVVFRKIDPT